MDIQIRPNRVRRMVEEQIAENHGSATDTHGRLLRLGVLCVGSLALVSVGATNARYVASLATDTGAAISGGAFAFLLTAAVGGLPLAFSAIEHRATQRIVRDAWALVASVSAIIAACSAFDVSLTPDRPLARVEASTAASGGPVEWEQPIGYQQPARNTTRQAEPSDFEDLTDEEVDDPNRKPYARLVKNAERWFAAAEAKKRGIERQTHNCRIVNNALEDMVCSEFYRLAKMLASARAEQAKAIRDQGRASRFDAVERIDAVSVREATFGDKAFNALMKIAALILGAVCSVAFVHAQHGLSAGRFGKTAEPAPEPALDMEPDREAMARADFDAWADACLAFDPSSTVGTRSAFISYEASVRGKGGKPMQMKAFADELARRVYELGGSRNVTNNSSFDGVSLTGATGTMGGSSQAFGSSDFGFGKGF